MIDDIPQKNKTKDEPVQTHTNALVIVEPQEPDYSQFKRLANFGVRKTQKIKIHQLPDSDIDLSQDLLPQFEGQDFGIIFDEETLKNFILNRGPAYVQTKTTNYIAFGFDGAGVTPKFITSKGKKKLGTLDMDFAISTLTF